MSKVTFENENVVLEVEPGTSILEAARKAGIAIESPCNGAGVCGKCKLYRTQVSPMEALLIRKCVYTSRHEDEGYILACQACIQDDINIRLNEKKEKNLKILSKGKTFNIDVASPVSREYHADRNETEVRLDGNPTAVEKGDTTDENYGVVVDIGTTTLVASLVNLNTGVEITSESALNPQANHAQDVLSRINMAAEEDGLHTLFTEVIDQINDLIGVITDRAKADRGRIYETVFSGNTCMIHLATNTNPEGLGEYPYIPAIVGGNCVNAKELGLQIAEKGRVYIPPIISAFVGPDITSGVLATQIEKEKGVTLFVDIGTNGEMIFANNGKLAATSTAAGPAFEGMNIEFGMRAANGAIETFEIDEKDDPKIGTIGNAPAVGICGSGLLDIVGELVAHQVITKSGKFEKRDKLPGKLADRIVEKNGKPVFLLTEDVWLTQKDIRQVQLAKGAIRAGIEFLMLSQNKKADEVDRVEIAGSFGYHLKTKSLINIGLLPSEFRDKVEYVGNTSKTGGEAFLLNNKYRTYMKQLVTQIETIELSKYDNFQKVFVKCLGF